MGSPRKTDEEGERLPKGGVLGKKKRGGVFEGAGG